MSAFSDPAPLGNTPDSTEVYKPDVEQTPSLPHGQTLPQPKNPGSHTIGRQTLQCGHGSEPCTGMSSIHPHSERDAFRISTHVTPADAALVPVLVAAPAVAKRSLLNQNEVVMRLGVSNVVAGERLTVFATHDKASKFWKRDRNTDAVQTILEITAQDWRVGRNSERLPFG